MSKTRTKSILFLTYHFPPEIGGIQTRISKYIDIFAAMGISIDVFVVSNNSRSEPYYVGKATGVKYVSGESLFVFPVILKAIRTIYHKKVDVVHVFTGASTVLGCSFVILGKLLHRKAIISFFGSEDFANDSFIPKLTRVASLSLSDGIATNSIHTMRRLPQKFVSKTRVILGGSDFPTYFTVDAQNTNKIILFVGRLVLRKGVDDLLKAFKIVRSKIPDASLEIVGDGPERERLINLATSLGVSDRVSFRGVLRGESLQRAYSRSYTVVLPSKRVLDDFADEGLGLSLIEASMYGKPLIGTRSGGIPEIIQDSYNGFLVRESDPESLANALTRILGDEKLAKLLGENSRRRAQQLFTWESSAQRLLAVYSD